MLHLCPGSAVRIAVAAGVLASAAGSVRAGLSPENIAVVVNGDSWASLAIANEYARLRGIPDSHFIVLGGITAPEVTDADRFRTEILGPVFAAIEQRGLTAQIDCIAYSCDLPYAVNVGGDMAGRAFPQIITPVASANGLTYLHEWVAKKDPEYLSLGVNVYARRTLPLVTAPPLTPQEQAEYRRGMTLYDAKKYAEAARAIAAVGNAKRSDAGLFYNLACCQALAGKPEEAMAALHDAVDLGWRNHGQITTDPDLASLAQRPDLKKLVEELKARKIEMQAPRGFRARYAWDPIGEPGADHGPHYMLSTMLGVTCGRGNSVNEVIESLRRAAGADGDAPRGTVYFLKNGDVRSATRDWAFGAAIDELRRAGVNGAIEQGSVPQGKKDVAGAMIGIADFDWAASQSQILPGAICEHLTSLGGIISERGGQTPCTDLIRAGAAGTSGTVTEPFALQEKFPTAFMHVQYAQGSTLAEAFYQAVSGPYQLLIIGDPLCRPWGHAPKVSITAVAPGKALEGKADIRAAAAGGGRSPVGSLELYADGRFITSAEPGQPLPLDTSKLCDGEHELSVVAVQKDAIAGCGHASTRVSIQNQGHDSVVAKKPPAHAVFGKPLLVEVACEGATSIELWHLGRVVGRCDGPSGTIELDTHRVGPGHVLLHPVAHLKAAPQEEVTGVPFTVQVDSAPSIGPKPPPPGAKVEKGLGLSIAGAKAVPIEDTISGDWLQKAGARGDKPFELIGYFDVPKQDVYQIQVNTNTRAKVEIGDLTLVSADGPGWRFAPAWLRPGVHRLRITGTSPDGAALDIRIGSAGAFHPAADRFRHITP